MNAEKYALKGKELTLYFAEKINSPLIVLNTYTGDGITVFQELKKLNCPDINLLVVGNLEWDHDMTPWECPPLYEKDTPCTGGADDYLDLLIKDIIPMAKSMIKGIPSFIGIAGYSLAGLFSLYSLYKCDIFDRAASMSGSLWFPNFEKFVYDNKIRRKPDKIYISLGNKESKTNHPLLKEVQNNTDMIVEHYKSNGINVIFESNEGNHFKEPALRSAKGIMGML